MDKNINLVVGRTFDIEKQLRRVRIIKIIAIGTLIAVLITSLVFFLITIFLPTSSIKKSQQETLTNISLLHKKLVSYSLVNDRISNISTIINHRKNYGEVSSAVLNKIPPELNVDTLSIDDNILTIVVTGTSLKPVNQVIEDMIVMANNNKLIKNLLIESLTLSSQTGRYSLSIQADIL